LSEREKKGWSARRLVLDLVLVAVCVGAVGYLFQPHLDQGSLGGDDNGEWRAEARDRQTWAQVFDFRFYSGRHGPSAYYNPVQMIIWRLMIASFDYDTRQRPYYVLCLLIHALNAILVFLLGRELLKESLPAFGAALAFALFLPNYDTVGWVAAMITTGASGFFLFATVYLFLLYSRTRRTVLVAASWVTYVLCLFTKEFAVFAIPILGACYLIMVRQRALRPLKADLLLLPYCLLTVPMACIVLARLQGSAIVNEWGGFNFGIHAAYRFFDLFGFLVTAQRVGDTARLLCVAVALAGLPVLCWAARKQPVRGFLAAWLAIALLVYSFSNFRDIYTLGRYLYQPSAPWFLLVFSLLPEKRTWPRHALMALLFVCTAGYGVYSILEAR
jgi:hypothetical protein